MIDARTAWLAAAAFAIASACATREAAGVQKELEIGAYRIQITTPAGWELLDQGAQKRFRKGESDIVLQNLGTGTRAVAAGETEPIRDLDQLADWGLTRLEQIGNDQRREVRSRRSILIDGREALEVDTWNRLDHTWPQRLLFVRADDDLISLHTARLADADTARAFDAIRDSIQFAATARR